MAVLADLTNAMWRVMCTVERRPRQGLEGVPPFFWEQSGIVWWSVLMCRHPKFWLLTLSVDLESEIFFGGTRVLNSGLLYLIGRCSVAGATPSALFCSDYF